MKKMTVVILFAVAAALSASNASAQSVCQTRWFGGGFYTNPVQTPDIWGVNTDSPYGIFYFDFPGEEGAAEIIAWSASVPTAYIAPGGLRYIYGDNGTTKGLYPEIKDGITFGSYYVRPNGMYAPVGYVPGAVGFKMTENRSIFKTTATSRYLGVAVFVETSVLVRICGNENQLMQAYPPQ